MKEQWVMPAWMEPYRNLINNTGGNSIEELMNSRVSIEINMPLAVLCITVAAEVRLLHDLHEHGFLPEAPDAD